MLATVGVYSLVALLVRMDDLGFKLIALNNDEKSFTKALGKALVKTLPFLVRTLAVLGTIAMILVAGGIFSHNVHFIHDIFNFSPSIFAEFIVGTLIGIIALLLVELVKSVVNAVKVKPQKI